MNKLIIKLFKLKNVMEILELSKKEFVPHISITLTLKQISKMQFVLTESVTVFNELF